MGANIEIDIFLQSNLCLKQIFSVLEKGGYAVSIQKFSIFDDWHYTNFQEIDISSRDRYLEDPRLDKFSLTNFTLNDNWECTLITSLEEEAYRDFSFGFPTHGLISASEKAVDDAIEAFYEKVATMINDTLSHGQFRESFVAASMGVEYSVEFNRNIIAMLQDENGAMKWVLPKASGLPLSLEKFSKEEKSDVVVFTYVYEV